MVEGVDIFELNNNGIKIAILRCINPNIENHKQVLDEAVKQYTNNKQYHDFIEQSLTCPYARVIIPPLNNEQINNNFVEFTNQKL